MLARQQQHFLAAFQFFQVTDVVPVNPHTRVAFQVRLSLEHQFTHHLVLARSHFGSAEDYQDPKTIPRRTLSCATNCTNFANYATKIAFLSPVLGSSEISFAT